MRVRSFFWFFLTGVCLSVLIFAAVVKRDVPALLQVHLGQPAATATGVTNVRIHFTDPEGQPIEQAQINFQAEMTNMKMSITPNTIQSLGNGNYDARLQFSMTGPWAIKITANAHGFHPQEQTLRIEVI